MGGVISIEGIVRLKDQERVRADAGAREEVEEQRRKRGGAETKVVGIGGSLGASGGGREAWLVQSV